MTSPERRRPWLPAMLLVGLALLGAAAAAAWMYRADLAATAAKRILEKRGLGPVSLTVRFVGLGSATAANVSLYGGAMRASGLTLTFEPGGLYSGRLDRIDIEGLRTNVVHDGRQVMVGGRSLPAAGESSGGDFSVALVTLRDFDIAATVPGLAEPMRVTGDARFIRGVLTFQAVATMEAGRGSVLEVRATGKHDTADGRGAASLAMSTLKFHKNSKQPGDLFPLLAALPRIDGEARGAGVVSWTGPAVDPDLVLHVDDVAFDLAGARTSGVAADLHVTRLFPPMVGIALRGERAAVAAPSLAVPLRLTGGGRLDDDTLTFEGVGKLSADKGSVLEILAAGRHDLGDGSGKASVTMRTLKFHRNSKQPKDLFPAMAGLPRIDGAARAAGTVSWNRKEVVPDLVVRLDDIAFDTADALVRQLDGELNIRQFAPLATAPHQVVTATVKAGGLPPSTLMLRFELLPRPAIKVEALTSALAGGRVSATPFIVDSADPSIDTVLHFSAVKLDQAFRLLNIEGVTGDGQLDGDVRLQFKHGKLIVDDSRLVASGPGEINVTNRWLIEKLGGSHQSVLEALTALSDFHYDVLTVELDRAEGGTGAITLRLQGQNPAFLSGQRFNFNIRVESNFDRLTELAVRGVTAAQQLLRNP